MNNKSNKSIESIKKKIIPILRKNNIVRAGIFGSYARGEQKKGSDIDILVRMSKPVGFGFVGIQFELEKKLGRKVDLLTYKSVHPLLKNRILSEEVRII
jgi:predicted nucleotidyltransferase